VISVSHEDTEFQVSGTPLASPASRREAFEKLTQRRLDRAYGLAATILDGDAEAEDAVHDAALRAWLRWSSLRDSDRFDAWFDRIVVNVCRERLRRRAMAARKVIELAVPDSPAGAGLASPDDALRDALSSLGVDHRIVVVLRFLDDLTVDEIAARTGLRVGTVKSRLHYALRELRAAYDAARR
jgi:RNA polymerase sigma-70 factor (ECF subfamily)